MTMCETIYKLKKKQKKQAELNVLFMHWAWENNTKKISYGNVYYAESVISVLFTSTNLFVSNG